MGISQQLQFQFCHCWDWLILRSNHCNELSIIAVPVLAGVFHPVLGLWQSLVWWCVWWSGEADQLVTSKVWSREEAQIEGRYILKDNKLTYHMQLSLCRRLSTRGRLGDLGMVACSPRRIIVTMSLSEAGEWREMLTRSWPGPECHFKLGSTKR